MHPASSTDELTAMIAAARAAGIILREYFETPLGEEEKIDKSFVTRADRESEAAVIATLERAFPDYGVLGEESGESAGASDDRWIIDPLDGTANFMNAIPIFAVSIAHMKGERVINAVVSNPITGTIFSASRGRGAFVNDAPMRVSSDTKKNVVVTFGKSSKREDGERVNALFVATQQDGFRVRYLGSAALELAYLARGGTDGYFNIGTHLWDYAAGTLLVEEAGGMITDLSGRPWRSDERYFIASNGKIHDRLLARAGTERSPLRRE